MNRRRLVSALAMLVAAGATEGCAKTYVVQPGASTSTPVATSADVGFATDMIPHHRQAIVMADMAIAQASDPRVLALARSITAAQQPEIDLMAGWLTSWGRPVPTGSGMGNGPGGGMMGWGAPGPGMMSSGDLDALGRGTGSGFDRMFLTMMIPHHEGAVAMATTEQRAGTFGPEIELARSIEISQTAEIATMRALLAEMGQG